MDRKSTMNLIKLMSDTSKSNGRNKTLKTNDLRRMLEQSDLNTHGFFDLNVRRETDESIAMVKRLRTVSPIEAKMVKIEERYGGIPRRGQ